MARLPIQNVETATGTNKDIFAALQKGLGMVPNMARVMANSPAVLQGYVGLSGALSKGALSGKVREQIALAVAEANGCDYCLAAHSVLGKMNGLSPQQIHDSRQASASDATTQALLRFARLLVDQRGRATNADLQAVRAAGVDDAAIAEVVANVALNLFTNYFNHVAQTDIDFPKAEAVESSNADVHAKLTEMLAMLKIGQMTQGQEKYFADDVVTQEGNDPPVFGKQAAIDRLSKFRETVGITGFVAYKIGSVVVNGNVSFYDAVLSVKVKDGSTINLEQVVRTEWKDGKIINERYYHG